VGTGRCAKRESRKLKTRILEEIAAILQEEHQNAMSNLIFFLKKCTACDGGHLTDIISRI
jgi:predicted secreted protein